MKDSAIGQVVDGYRIESVLGRGGMGVVYKAEDVALSRPVAIKRVNPSQSNRDMFLHRFRSEARALARIDSPHIVSVYALRETDLGLLIVMEYVDGGTLEDRLQGGPMPLDEALPLFKQMLQAFGDAHKAGVIHRDIKPQNVMLTQDGMVKVTDFGIAKMRKKDTGKTVTQGGQGGTLKYMSPEQISDIEAVDDTSDIYALGMVAYQMLVGKLPFDDAETDFDIMRKVVEGKLPSPTEYRADLPAPLVELITTATAKRQADRYESTDAMMAVIDAFEQEAELDTENATEPQAPTGTATPPAIDVEDMPETAPSGETAPAPPPADATATAPALGGETVLADAGDSAAPADTAAPQNEDTGSAGRPPWLWGAVAAGLLALVAGVWALGGSGSEAATLSITTTPANAAVYVEGDSIGTTPIQNHALAAGPTQVQLRKPGHMPVDTTLQLEAATPYALADVALPRATARLAIDTEPAAARVFVDREAVGTTPLNDPLEVPTGERTLRIEKDGYVPVDTVLAVDAAERPVRFSVALSEAAPEDTGDAPAVSSAPPAAAMATLAVEAQPRGEITVAGASATGAGTFDVTAGRHEVVCTHPEYGSVRTTVTVQGGQREQLRCYFERPVRVNSEPWGSVWIDSQRTSRTTPTEEPLYLGPGTHEVQVRVERQDRILSGGAVRITRGGVDERERFSGYTYALTIEPSFEPVEYAITFTD